MLESLFNKAAGLKACNFIKKRLQHRYFLVNIVKYLRIAFCYRTPPVVASESQCFYIPDSLTPNILNKTHIVYCRTYKTLTWFSNFRSRHRRCSVRKGVLKNLTKFTGKHMCQICFLLKKRLWHRCFPVNFAKFLRTPFLTEHLWQFYSCSFLLFHKRRKTFICRLRKHQSLYQCKKLSPVLRCIFVMFYAIWQDFWNLKK